ncbi:DNA cytosine methyltransferase [Pseudomonas syringae]|uniref:DNA cytosine methyltransferase n=1 Tax=Pseudomonas syringae TaxID=317 RepID=UPI00035263FF|nr:DNA cytosine methyltransferase [Pseudomonas syringae]EPF66256.1 Prophage PssSM-02, DNA (cytosine-5-)-methyltransferase [Pseudomonas syringae pv. syringae SM]
MSAHQQYPPLQYGSVCSGIEAATAAWHPLGMEPVWFAEIEPFPSAVLAHHYPRTPNLGDMTRLGALVLAGKIKAPDVLIGGTPCQAFSVAGMRQGMLDPRGALTIKYVELADAVDHVRTSRNQPESIIVWENVPGVLSDNGNAFGCFLGALAGEDCELQPPGKRWQDAGCVYGPKRTIAWRILDAQYFGLAQRRRRVFLVASARAGFDPTAVLFEREGMRRDNPPSRESRQDVTGTLSSRSKEGGGLGADFDLAGGLQAVDVCPTLRAGGNSTGGDRPPGTDVDTADSLIVVHGTQYPCVMRGLAHALGRHSGQGTPPIQTGSSVRRLTPRECERLQGFPDDYTRIPWRGRVLGLCPDGPRYKAIGNSKAVPVVRWTGMRIQQQL